MLLSNCSCVTVLESFLWNYFDSEALVSECSRSMEVLCPLYCYCIPIPCFRLKWVRKLDDEFPKPFIETFFGLQITHKSTILPQFVSLFPDKY